jgi:hypothetical protein
LIIWWNSFLYSVLSVFLLFCLIHGSRKKAGEGEQAKSVDGGENFILNTTATNTLLTEGTSQGKSNIWHSASKKSFTMRKV